MKGKDVLFSHKSDEWETPDVLYNSLNMEFSFTLDPCATHDNHKTDRYCTQEDEFDGLNVSWANERVFVNPPYSSIYSWVLKATQEVGKWDQEYGCIVVMLLPARTDTKWFHEFIWDDYRNKPKTNVEVRFIKGRLKFKGVQTPIRRINDDGQIEVAGYIDSNNSAPFPSMVVVFR